MIIEFYILGLLKPFENLEFFDEVKFVFAFAFSINNNIDRFNLDDVSFFDSFYKDKFIDIIFVIKYINKSIFFYNIYVFVDRVKDIARVKDNVLL